MYIFTSLHLTNASGMENPTNENPFPFFLLPEMEDDGHFDTSHPYLQISCQNNQLIDTPPRVSTPLKINGWNIIPWRFGSDHVPFFSWVMAVASSRSSSRASPTCLRLLSWLPTKKTIGVSQRFTNKKTPKIHHKNGKLSCSPRDFRVQVSKKVPTSMKSF